MNFTFRHCIRFLINDDRGLIGIFEESEVYNNVRLYSLDFAILGSTKCEIHALCK